MGPMNNTDVYPERKRVHFTQNIQGLRYIHAGGNCTVKGFTLLEVVVGIAIIAIVAGTLATIYPFNVDIVRKGAEETEISLMAQSVKDAIITGVRENYNPYDNSFFFIFEGVAVWIRLPAIGEEADFPGGYGGNGFKEAGKPTLGLYPSGLLYRGQIVQVFRFKDGSIEIKSLNDEDGNYLYDYFIGPPLEEDFDLNGGYTDVNRNAFPDTFEDVGTDGLRDKLEPGYDPIHNPDPACDNYDPVRNPSGTERNGRFDAKETFADLNGDGIRQLSETYTDENGNGRFDGETDLNENGYLGVPDFRTDTYGYYPLQIKTYLQDPSVRITNYGYTIKVINDGGNVFTFEIAVYKDFYKVRPGLQSARQDILDAIALPEADTGNAIDDDGDGVEDDKVITDADHKIDRVNTHPAALPEMLFDGMDNDDDNDDGTFGGVNDAVDDGLVKPDFVVRFQMLF